MTNETDEVLDRRILAAEEYGDALRNWDKVHSAYLRNEVNRDADVAAWDRRRAAFDKLKSIEAELESEKPA